MTCTTHSSLDIDHWPEWRYSGSHEKPDLLWEAFESSFAAVPVLRCKDVFAEVFTEAYTGRNLRMRGDLTHHQWLRLFRHAGFISDGRPRADQSLVVYRGSYWPYAPAWTTDLDTAAFFASCHKSGIWQLRVRPRHILALFDGMDEHEVVVSPSALYDLERMLYLENEEDSIEERTQRVGTAGRETHCGIPRLG